MKKQNSLIESKMRVQHLWTGFNQNKIILPQNDVPQFGSFMDSDGENNLFHGLINNRTIRTDPDAETVDEYVKYINKDRDEDIHNPLQWWRDHQSTYPNLAQMALIFLPYRLCLQNVSGALARLAKLFQLVEVIYKMILWKVGRHCAHGCQLEW